MNLIQLIACIGLITGCFVLLHISPMDFTEGVFRRITSKPKSIRSEVNESTRRKKKSFLRREIEETQTILRMTGRAAKFPMVCALSLLLFLVGAAFALTLGNLLLVPVLAVGMMFVPFWFIRLTANHYKKNIAAELETALSISPDGVGLEPKGLHPGDPGCRPSPAGQVFLLLLPQHEAVGNSDIVPPLPGFAAAGFGD